MPRRPLSELRPQDFPKIGDEENAFDSDNEDTDDECMEDDGENTNTNTTENEYSEQIDITDETALLPEQVVEIH